MLQIIVGRVVSGIGAAGMVVIVSVLIAGHIPSFHLLTCADKRRSSSDDPDRRLEELCKCNSNSRKEYWGSIGRLSCRHNRMATVPFPP